MMKYLLSLMLVTAMTCKCLVAQPLGSCRIERCENDEAICYIYDGYKAGGLSCKFKEQE